MKIHYKKYFQDWQQEKLKPRQKQRVEAHLRQCEACRRYFQKMALLFTAPPAGERPQIELDPYALTRIKAHLIEQSAQPQAEKSLRPMMWGIIYSTLSAAALFLGIWLGMDLAQPKAEDVFYNFAAEQQQIFEQPGNAFAQIWETMEVEENGEN
ncbi:MAG: zf-HC2 domain-containing protein [Calditrichia bacterium]